MIKFLHAFLCLLTLIAISACSNSENSYPPVKLDFLSMKSDGSGTLTSAVTDRGERVKIVEDKTGTVIKKDTTIRVVANIEQPSKSEAIIYALAPTISSIPLLPTSKELENGIKTDPARLLSIWEGYGYLNILLSINTYLDKHTLCFVEKENTIQAEKKIIKILLYHDAGKDKENAFNAKRAYLSIPIQQYFEADHTTVTVYFSYNNEADQLQECGPYEFKNNSIQ